MAISFKGAHFPKEVILMGVRWLVRERNCPTRSERHALSTNAHGPPGRV